MSNELTSLSTLAVEIDALNEQANIFANQAVIYAAKSGQKLLLAKAQCNHGQFKSWLDENCKIPYSTAQKYMRLATANPELVNSNSPSTAILPSITQMIELLSAPEEVKTEVTAKIEAGEDVTVKEIQRLKKEAAELLVEKEAIQRDLLTTKELLECQSTKYQAASRQRDKLRDNQAQIIDAKLGEERAKLILENQDAIAQAKREAENAKDEIERLKKDQVKAIKDGVFSEIQKRKTEIDQLEYRAESLHKQMEELQTVRDSLDSQVGVLAIHKESIKNIKENLSFITAHFEEAFYTREIPPEVLNDWQAIHHAVSQIKRQIGLWFDQRDAIESESLINNLVDLGTILENVQEAHV